MPKYYHRPGTLPKTAHKELLYKVVVYHNQKPCKTLYKSRTIYPARRKYYEYLANNQIIFPKRWDWLGNPLTYELLLLGNWGEAMEVYKAPSGVVYNVGRKTKDGFLIKDIQPYLIEEKIKYYNQRKMVTFKDVVKIMVREKYTKTMLTFNNKLLIEIYEKDVLHLFILKNKMDAQRLYDEIKKFYHANNISDCFFFQPPPRGVEQYDFYQRISDKLGISRVELRKISTRA